MKTLVLIALVGCLFVSREAAAQGFFYGAPDFSDLYGVNLGNGVGFGYGIGITLPPNALNSSITDTYVPPYPEPCESNPSFIIRGQVIPQPTQALPMTTQSKVKLTKKKTVSKVTTPKTKPVLKAKPAKQ